MSMKNSSALSTLRITLSTYFQAVYIAGATGRDTQVSLNTLVILKKLLWEVLE